LHWGAEGSGALKGEMNACGIILLFIEEGILVDEMFGHAFMRVARHDLQTRV